MFKDCNIAKSCLKVNIKHQNFHKSCLSIYRFLMGSNPPLLTIYEHHPQRGGVCLLAYPEGFEPTTLSVGS